MINLNKNNFVNYSEGFDRVGTVGCVRGETGFVVRIINKQYEKFFVDLFSKKKLKPLLGTFMPDTKISDRYIGPDGEIVLEHAEIPDINYLFEWSREMTKDAGIFLLDITIEAIKNDLYIKDSHAFNITFENKKPIFFDFGSIQKNKNEIGFVWVDHFFHNFVFPVNYFEVSDGKKYREFAIRHLNRPFNWCRFFYYSFFRAPIHTIHCVLKYFEFILRRKFIKNSKDQINFLKKLKQYLNNSSIAYPKTKWGNYSDQQQIKLRDKNLWDVKMKNISLLTNDLQIETLLDIGGNSGLYAELIKIVNPTLKKLTITDYDEVAIDQAYKDTNQLNNAFVVDFAVIDQDTQTCFKPPQKTVYPKFTSRTKSDLAMLLALIHHLVYFQNYNFDTIIHKLYESTQKYIIMEFISNDDFHVQKWFKNGIMAKPWYTLDNLKNALEKKFIIKQILPSGSQNEDRYLILCKKK